MAGPVRINFLSLGLVLSRVLLLTAVASVCTPTIGAAEGEDFLLGTRFGMSQPDVRAALEKRRARLLEYSDYEKEYENVTAKPLIKHPHGGTFLTEEFAVYHLFMPSLPGVRKKDLSILLPVRILGATVEGQFRFEAEHLTSIELFFRSDGDPKTFAARIEKYLNEHYEATAPWWPSDPEMEEAMRTAWPHAYQRQFKSKSMTAVLWVNIVDVPEPILKLSLSENLRRPK